MPVPRPFEENYCVVVKRAMPHSTLRPFKDTFFGSAPVSHGPGGLAADCRGGMFIETILVVLIFSLVGTAVLSGISGTRSSGARTERQGFAENIARNQIEYVFTLPYQEPPSTYPSIDLDGQDYAGYAVTGQAIVDPDAGGNPNIERVMVEVLFGGEEILSLETLRTK